MPSLKLTKSAVDSAQPGTTDYELRDTIVPGFFCKITPAGRKVFMLSYRTPTGERRSEPRAAGCPHRSHRQGPRRPLHG